MPTYTLLDISREENVTPEGIEVTRVFHCTPYSARAAVYDTLIGGVRLRGGILSRVLPASDPYFPWCRVDSIQTSMLDEDYLVSPSPGVSPLRVGSPYNGPAVMTVHYKTPHYTAPEEIELVNQSWEFSAQNLTLPNERYGWKNDDPISPSNDDDPSELLAFSGIAATKTIPRLEYAITRHLIPRKPINAIMKLLGRINKTTFTVGRDRYPPGTLRFDSASASQKVTNRGIKFFDVTYKFAVMPVFDWIDEKKLKQGFVTWNRLFDPRKGFWRRVVLFKDPKRGIYLFDTDIKGLKSKGFRLLFDRVSS